MFIISLIVFSVVFVWLCVYVCLLHATKTHHFNAIVTYENSNRSSERNATPSKQQQQKKTVHKMCCECFVSYVWSILSTIAQYKYTRYDIIQRMRCTYMCTKLLLTNISYTAYLFRLFLYFQFYVGHLQFVSIRIDHRVCRLPLFSVFILCFCLLCGFDNNCST